MKPKIFKKIYYFFSVSLLLCPDVSWSVLRIASPCSDEAIVKVEKIIDFKAPSSYLQKASVLFSVEKIIKGQDRKKVSFTILKNGPVKVKEGVNYRVSSREGWICNISVL